ncbi:hypothetical protein, partial [Acetobacter estunensis]|uniref:hypothetical protein n=1 Tax=Acetobacter estunensis TaxID=104097 RepID=UPI001C2D8AE9
DDSSDLFQAFFRHGACKDGIGLAERIDTVDQVNIEFTHTERNRLPSVTSTDPWEQRMAEGAAAFVRFKDEGRYE